MQVYGRMGSVTRRRRSSTTSCMRETTHESSSSLPLVHLPILLPSYLVAPPCRQVAAALTLDYKSTHSTPARSASTSRHIHASLPQKGAQFRWAADKRREEAAQSTGPPTQLRTARHAALTCSFNRPVRCSRPAPRPASSSPRARPCRRCRSASSTPQRTTPSHHTHRRPTPQPQSHAAGNEQAPSG